MKRLFITGISGCIGHYVADELMRYADYELFFLVRNPQKLQFDLSAFPHAHIVEGDMSRIEEHEELLKSMDVAVLIATSWGDPKESFEINVVLGSGQTRFCLLFLVLSL